MDVLQWLPEYRMLVCKRCGVAVTQGKLFGHLRQLHMQHSSSFATPKLIHAFIKKILPTILDGQILDPSKGSVILPAPDREALPGLKVIRGFGCNHCSFVSKNLGSIQRHFNENHAAVRRRRGGLLGTAKGNLRDRLDLEHFGESPAWHPAHYQRFFNGGPGSNAFRVRTPEQEIEEDDARERMRQAHVLSKEDFIVEEVLRRLADHEEKVNDEGAVLSEATNKTQISPWLERTKWPKFMSGLRFSDLLPLARSANLVAEPMLIKLTSSIDRLVESAYKSVCDDKINFFAQRRINSFLPKKTMYSQPLMVKLQRSTYQRYKELWKRLLCFVFRSVNASDRLLLRHQLTAKQTELYDKLLTLCFEQEESSIGVFTDGRGSLATRIDDACLDFCIALLDHHLKGDLFESTVLGFLAVLGIDEKNSTFFEAQNYTPILSGFIKIGQMLVLQKAVRAVESEEVEEPVTILDEMRERFMTIETYTPFSWAVQLRSYGKRVRDSITSLGYIQWSEDNETIFYKDLEIHIGSFRRFVVMQVKHCQALLEDLFLLRHEEKREDVVPSFALHRVRDNPARVENGWSFLLDERNNSILPGHREWLLYRVLKNEWLRDEFLTIDREHKVVWCRAKAQEYLKKLDKFLESLLLLIHITSGQPARGTEIMSIRHSNTVFHRNIFVEDGLVALVTSYHKGYTCTGTTKIIHRYLPREVSELLIYYLWLILPFKKQLETLALLQNQEKSSFLWSHGEGTWTSQKLSDVLRKETAPIFKAAMTISTYRHVAIALSRRHLRGGGFRRDYGIEEKSSDRQTTHNSWTAGRLYARGLEEAPGFVEARRSEFRAVSREWHSFLGFTVSLGAQKRQFEDDYEHQSKRARI